MKSIDNFDPTIGVKFSTYAVPMIIGEVRRYLRCLLYTSLQKKNMRILQYTDSCSYRLVFQAVLSHDSKRRLLQ